MTLVTGVTRNHAVIPALDGFRALAILIVMLSHVGLQHIVPGQFGVTLFFFLSGYLITTLLRREVEAEGGIDLRRFYMRRAVRILPPMYLTIAFIAILSLAGIVHRINLSGLPYDFLFLTNYFPVSGIPIGLWSLAVEEHFYLGFPLLLALLVRRLSFARCALVCLGLCGVALAVRVWEVQRLTDLSDMIFMTHTRIDSILYGSILGLWNNPVADETDVLPKRMLGYAMAAGLLLPTFLLRDEMFRQTLRYTLQGLGLLLLFNTAIRDRGLVSRVLNNAITRQIAILSYTLYLIHSSMILAFGPSAGGHPALPMAAAFACAFGYALLMYYWVEKPLNRWRRKTEAAWSADEISNSGEGQPAVVRR